MKKVLLFCCVVVLTQTAFGQWVGQKSPEYDRPEEYDKWFFELRKVGLGYIPKDARLNALKQRDALRDHYNSSGKQEAQSGKPIGTLADVSWTSIGPENIATGMMHAGRVRSIAPHPTDPNIAYIGTAGGGIWKTTNQGLTWSPLSDDAYSLATGAVGLDPSNPNVIYVGTGEANGGIDSYYGIGMLKSTDGGDTWRPSGLPNVGGFSRVIVHPTKSNIVYAAGAHSGGGLYLSKDAGATWTKIGGTLPPGNVTDLSLIVDGSNDVLHAAMPSQGIFRSMNGGESWELIHAFTDMRRILIGVYPNDWRDVVAMSVSAAGSLERIDRTMNGADFEPIATDVAFGGLFGGNNQGWYDAYVLRTPNDPDRIIVGGISVWMSEDGGSGWTDVGLAYKGGIHPDQHAAAYSAGADPVLYVACDGGIAISTDKGANFTVHQDNLAITQFYGMAIDQTTDDVTYGGTQDNGTLGGGRTGAWDPISGGDGGTVVVDEDKPSRVYFVRPGDGQPPSKVEDGVEYQLSTGISNADSVGWVKPLVMDQTNNILYYGTQYFYLSTNAGASWTKRSKKLASDSYINTIEPYGNGSTIAVGTTNGLVWLTINKGQGFIDITKDLPGRSISNIKFSPVDSNTMYVALSGFGNGHVFKTTNRGGEWKNASGTLPDIPCVALIIDPQHPTNLYVATDIGVFFSPDDGVNWLPFGTGLPNVGIGDMQYHRSRKTLRVATHGRSMWEAPLADNLDGISTPNIVSKWFIGENGDIAWYGVSGPVDIELSLDGGGSWKPIASGVTGTTYTIQNLKMLPTDHAIVKVVSGSTTVLSQNFRIMQRIAGATIDVVSEQPLYMYDIAYEPSENVIWVTNFSASDSRIYKIDPNTGERLGSINTGKTELTGIKWSVAKNRFYVHQSVTSQKRSYIHEVAKTGEVLKTYVSPAVYGTGLFPLDDTLFVADRNNNVIFRRGIDDPAEIDYDPIDLERKAAFGPRCVSYNPVTKEILHTWTDFQGTEQSATLYDSYLLRFGGNSLETGSTFVQEGTNAGTNVRGCEYVPNSDGKAVWVTVLNSGNSSKILRISLEAGPPGEASVKWGRRFEGKLLKENYPNPFNGKTTLTYDLPASGRLGFIVRDELGREVLRSDAQPAVFGTGSRILDLGQMAAGMYSVELWLDGERADVRRIVKQ